MSSGLPRESSVFAHFSIEDIYEQIRTVYRRYPQPWVIGYSGGKDSTAVLQLVWKALEGIPREERMQKPIFVIASDTKVETPVIVDYIDTTLTRINEAALTTSMPFQAVKVVPSLNDSFWVNLIGRGYPAPTSRFRWCTERMKINPANRFIEEKVTQFGEVILVLGVRKTESSTRMQLMSTYQVNGHVLRRHASLTGAYVFAPIADFSTEDVWSYLLQVPSPWGSNNRDLAALYRSASSGECPLVIDTSTPSCGNSRFGCWVCTVAKRDSSMEALIDSGEEWMEPLLEFRDWLSETTEPERKRDYRDIRGRDGRVIFKKDGTLAARSYTLDTSKQMLQRLLKIQQSIRQNEKDRNLTLISDEELHEIRRIWRTERQDWADSVPQIYTIVVGNGILWQADDNGHFDHRDAQLLSGICQEYDVPFELLARLIEAERRNYGLARRSRIFKDISAELSRDWRSEEEILAAGPLNTQRA